jgi:alcohol dehydrogenase
MTSSVSDRESTTPRKAGVQRGLNALIGAHHIKPVVDRVYPLESIAEAHRYVEAGHKRGGVAITI